MSPRPKPHGSTLVLAMVLLAILSVIGVAAVSLASQERTNAAAKGKRDALAACASAARLAIWAELARYGQNHLDSAANIAEITLSDGTKLTAPAHYDTPLAATVQELKVERVLPRCDDAEIVDLTNTFDRASNNCRGRSYAIVARCTDAHGRKLEVEFTTAFAL